MLSSPVSTNNAERYTWGAACQGWHLVRTAELSVIEERMPPGAAEVRHHHRRARQFFYVLEGAATLEMDGIEHRLRKGEGLEVAPGAHHHICNSGCDDLRLLVISQPPSHGDRQNGDGC